MEQSYLDFRASDLISFILTIFSTVLAIVPFIEPTTQDHHSDQTSINRALSIVSDKNNEPVNTTLWAYTVLHDWNNVEKLESKETNSSEAMLAAAAIHYNNDSPTEFQKYLDNTQRLGEFNPTYTKLKNEFWFTNRTLNLENPSIPNSPHWKEDLSCSQMNESLVNPTMCSYDELASIKRNLTDLEQNGHLTNFYNNNDQKIHTLQNKIDTFVSYLNHFIIISLITGPIAFVTGIRYFIRKKGGTFNDNIQ